MQTQPTPLPGVVPDGVCKTVWLSLTSIRTRQAQGMLTSLELLPMWSGVEPDVALFASGRVLDEGGDWTGGHQLSDAGDAAGAHFSI